jgi:hypothetical protein
MSAQTLNKRFNNMPYNRILDQDLIDRLENTDTSLVERHSLYLELLKRYKNSLVEKKVVRGFMFYHHGCKDALGTGGSICSSCKRDFGNMGIKDIERVLLSIAGVKALPEVGEDEGLTDYNE